MTFRFIEVDEIIGNEIETMKDTIDPAVFDSSLDTVAKLTNIQSKMYDNELKGKRDEFEREKDLREFEFKQKQADRDHEARMKELDIRRMQIELERLKADREFEIKMRELDEKAKDKEFNWYSFVMDVMDKFGVAGLMAMVLHYEKLEAITTKAWQIVLKCIRLRH